MYKRILVPLDGSELAGTVFSYAKEIAGKLDLEIVILNVCRSEHRAFIEMRRVYVEHMAEVMRRQLVEVRERLGIQFEDKTVGVRGEVAIGEPAEEILRFANENNIDFILLGTHGFSGIKRWILGSVADKILRSSKIPICLVRTCIPDEIIYDKWPRMTILVTLDCSELAESVLPHVKILSKQRGDKPVDVVLLSVCNVPIACADRLRVRMPENLDKLWEPTMSWFRDENERYLASIEKQLKDTGIKVKSEILVGDPASEIIEYVNRNPFSLIAMATHGRSGRTRWAYASVTDRVLHGTCHPIFLVRPD